MEPKICPILGAGPLEINSNCKGEHCAWYICGRCAIAALAEATEEASGHIEDIALKD